MNFREHPMTELGNRVILIHTNDIHSHLEEASRIAGYVKDVRRRVPKDQMLIVDCGDFLDRARPETEGTEGRVNAGLIREIGYDALVPGNNEGLTYSFEQMDSFYREASVPVVCANFAPLARDIRLPWLFSSLIVRKSGLDIGLIGLTVPFNDYYRQLGWSAADPAESLAIEVRRIRSRVDLIVVLSHLGLRQDERLAAEVPGVDVILGGHTHHLLEKPLRIGDTVICAAGKFGRHIGCLNLTRLPGDRRIAIEGGCIPVEGMDTDPEADALIAAGKGEARRRMGRVVAVLDEPLDWLPDRESPLSDLLAAVVRKRTGARIGLVNAGQFLGGVPAGEVTEEMIHAICPSPINCCVMMLKGSELLQAMEESLLPEFYGLEIKGFGFRGHRLGTLCYDGLEAEADMSLPPYGRIRNVRIGGEPLELDKEYEVGTLDMFTFGVGHVGLKEGRGIRYLLPEFIRELLCEALGDRRLIEKSRRPRLHIK